LRRQRNGSRVEPARPRTMLHGERRIALLRCNPRQQDIAREAGLEQRARSFQDGAGLLQTIKGYQAQRVVEM